MERGALYTLQVLKNPPAFGWTSLEGKLNVANSPGCFPNLNLSGRRFLHGVATAIHLSRISSLLFSEYNEELRRNYSLANIRSLTDVADKLVLIKDLDPLLFPPTFDFHTLHLFTQDGLDDIIPNRIVSIKMQFVSINDPRSDKKVNINFYPSPLRTYHTSGYDYLDGLTKDRAREALSFKKVAPDKIVNIVDNYSAGPMALVISSHQDDGNGADLKIIFAEKETKKTNIDQVTCQLSLTDGFSTRDLNQIQLSISEFSNQTMFTSQDALEGWLSNIAFYLATRAKPSQNIQVIPVQRQTYREIILV